MYVHLPFFGVWLVCFLVGLWACSLLLKGRRRTAVFWILAAVGSLVVGYALTALFFALLFRQF